MKKYEVFTDEKITLWQRVNLIIEANDENEVSEILSNPFLLTEKMGNGSVMYGGKIDPYWDTEDHTEFEHDNAEINQIGGDI